MTKPSSNQHELDHSAWWRRVVSKHPYRRGILAILFCLVVEYLVLPQIAGMGKSLHLLRHANIPLVALGIFLEVASLASYAKLTEAVLPKRAISLSRIWRIEMSTLAISHVIPGGTASGEGLGFHLLTNEGVSGSDVGFALAIGGIGSALVLNALLWLALIVSIPMSGFNPLYTTAAIIGALLLAAFISIVLLVTKGEDRAAVALKGLVLRLPFVRDSAAEASYRLVHQVADKTRALANNRSLLRRALLWAAADLLFDATSLFVFLAAFGKIENPDGLLVAYGLANVLAAIPITPGGLGIVEGVLVPSLVGFGATRGVAIVAVLGYRFFNFWLPIPVGAGTYLSLGAGGLRRANRSEDLRSALANSRSRQPTKPFSD